MRLGILTGDDGWGQDSRPYAGNEIGGTQLKWIRRHQQETGCPCTGGTMYGPFGGTCGNCGSSL